MQSIKTLFLLCMTGTLLASGCASVRVKTNLMPETDATLHSPTGRFYIAGLQYAVDGVDSGSTKSLPIDAAYEKRLFRLVRQECLARYPLLFTKDQTDSIPLWIEVEDSITSKDGKTLAWILCTATIVGTVFPAPSEIDRDLVITVGVWNGKDGIGSAGTSKDFQREQHFWLSLLTPLGLISIPGESDFPKESEAFNMGRFAYDDVPQVAQQVATAVAKLVAAQDADYWTAQPRQYESPAQSATTPAALPAPTETVAPF